MNICFRPVSLVNNIVIHCFKKKSLMKENYNISPTLPLLYSSFQYINHYLIRKTCQLLTTPPSKNGFWEYRFSCNEKKSMQLTKIHGKESYPYCNTS